MAALLALLAAVGWGSSDFAAGHASRRSSAVSVVVLTHLTAVLVLVCVAVDFGPVWTMVVDLAGGADSTDDVRWSAPQVVGRPGVADMGWGLAAGLGGGFGAMLLFRGLGKGSMAVVAPVTATGAATIPVLVGLATGESLAVPGLVGIALALVAIVLVSLSADDDAPDTGDTRDDPPAGPTGDAVDGSSPVADDPLTIPAGWVEEFGPGRSEALVRVGAGVPRPGTGPAPLPSPSAAGLVHPGPLPAATTTSVGNTSAPMAPIAPVAAARPVAAAEGAVTDLVRPLLGAIMLLLIALIVAGAGIAAGPIADLVSGAPLTAGHAAMLTFSLLTIVAAAASIAVVRPVIGTTSATGPAHRTAPPAPSGGRVSIVRRMLARPGLPEALLSGVGFGAFFVFIYRTSESAGHWPLVGARLVSVVMFAVGALITRTAVLPARNSRVGVMWAGLFDAAAAVLFVLATRAGLLSVGAVLASLYPAVTVLLARAVTKERINGRQLVGLAVALAAVGLLAV